MIRILVIDCQDSFVYNLIQILREDERCSFDIVQADELKLDQLASYQALLLSPGPGVPSDYPLLMQAISLSAESHAILGICLGHQAIVEHFGGGLRQMSNPLHGHASRFIYLSHPLFDDLSPVVRIGRYHSWVADRDHFPEDLSIIGTTEDDEGAHIMAVAHKTLPIYGLQFHPESIISEDGARYIHNFISIVEKR